MKARFTTTNKFLTEGMKQSCEMAWAAKSRAMLDVWIGWTETLLNWIVTSISRYGFQRKEAGISLPVLNVVRTRFQRLPSAEECITWVFLPGK